MRVFTIAGDREGGYFPKILNYKYKISTGSRCGGLVSGSSYKTEEKALSAGERMLNKLMKGAK
jgi:hypothetical protein